MPAVDVLGVRMSPLVYVVVFLLAAYRSLSDVDGALTFEDLRQAVYMGLRYCAIAWLLAWVVGAWWFIPAD